MSFILNSLIYFSYSIYLFVIGEVIQVTLFTSISLAIAVLYLLLKLDKIKIDIYELLSYILVSFPVPFISLPFIVARRKLSDSDSNLLMLIEAIVVILLVKYITLLPSLTLPIHV
ncbi:hypothetical protein V6M85_08475 [Sulfolobus tengchongensis]|uniref:Uncharacterized protein n=1 Tax=Sulfolobus tengchongensis TaxID=207809 RepID=A0AAX4KXE1_9CREN